MPNPFVSSSSINSYLSPEEFIRFRDIRTVSSLIDDGNGQPTEQEFLSSPVTINALMIASGRVEASCVKGNRYSPSDLANLGGVSLQFLKSIVATLAVDELEKRRSAPQLPPTSAYEEAIRVLKSIEEGELVFSFEEIKQGSRVETFSANPGMQPGRGYASTYQRYFGNRRGVGGI